MMDNEPEVVAGRQAFADTQTMMAPYPSIAITGEFSCGWYGTALNDERGAFCVVNADGPLGDQVGSYLRVSRLGKSVDVYCVEAYGLPVDLALSRRAFFGLAELWQAGLMVRVGRIEDNDES